MSRIDAMDCDSEHKVWNRATSMHRKTSRIRLPGFSSLGRLFGAHKSLFETCCSLGCLFGAHKSLFGTCCSLGCLFGAHKSLFGTCYSLGRHFRAHKSLLLLALSSTTLGAALHLPYFEFFIS